MSYERPENPEPSEWSKPRELVKTPFLENYATAAQKDAHTPEELDKVFQNPDYDNHKHFNGCQKCKKVAEAMINKDIKKFGKPRTDPGWMLNK